MLKYYELILCQVGLVSLGREKRVGRTLVVDFMACKKGGNPIGT
jgi:hypothetical protein